MARLTGVAAESLIGTSDHWRAFYDSPRPCLADLLFDSSGDLQANLYSQQKQASGKARAAENWCAMPALGRRLYLSINASAVHDADGRLVAVVETILDETAREEARAALEVERSGQIVRSAVEAMDGVEASSRKIGTIISVIDEIAFQTNLLALNAGVEAARAGDAGRGFAVVASEVRGLAQRSAEAAREIKTLIAAANDEVRQGVELVAETGQSLAQVIGHSTEMDGIVEHIAKAAKEEAASLREVNLALRQMDQVIQQNAAMAEETTAATHALQDRTAGLETLLRQFNLRPARHASMRRAA